MNLFMKTIYLIIILGLLSGVAFAKSAAGQQDGNKKKSTIKGVVTGDAQVPVQGALIKVINDTITTRTNSEGEFVIPVYGTDKGMIISVTAEGYRHEELYSQGRTELNISLLQKDARVNPTQKFDLGFVTQQKRVATATVDGLTTDKISEVNETAEQALQGQVAGVNMIKRSGMPGEGAYFDIRGISSLYASNSPLVILDGVYVNMAGEQSPVFDGIFSNPFANLNVSDIDNITVLKGAEAAAYGSLGANGVVIIDTKKSDGLETSINLSMQGGLSFSPDAIPVLKSGQFTSLMTELAHQRYDATEVMYRFP
ncbi:hypothetical protein EYV94_28575, partial [Puteibacter caeruleilacunae]